MRRLLLVPAVAALVSCGGGDSPSAPRALSTPTPTATLTLDAPSDHYAISRSLVELPVGKSFDAVLRPLQINQVAGERYLHAAQLWLLQTENHQSGDSLVNGTAVSLTWSSGAEWIVQSYLPGPGFADTGRRVQMALGEQRWVWISRRADGEAEFLFEGTSLVKLPIPTGAAYVYACVVGTKTEFAYAAPVLLRTNLSASGPLLCGDCPAGTND